MISLYVLQQELISQHPVGFFVPKNVKETLPVLYMAPSTEYVLQANIMSGVA